MCLLVLYYYTRLIEVYALTRSVVDDTITVNLEDYISSGSRRSVNKTGKTGPVIESASGQSSNHSDAQIVAENDPKVSPKSPSTVYLNNFFHQYYSLRGCHHPVYEDLRQRL